MSNSDQAQRDEATDDTIKAFLRREAARRGSTRLPRADVVAAISKRGANRRSWSTYAWLTIAAITALTVVVGWDRLLSLATPGSEPGASGAVPDRALNLPTVGVDAACPVTQGSTAVDSGLPLLGEGPLRLSLAEADGTAYFESTPGGPWKAIQVLWTAEPGFSASAVVRGARLDTPGELGFGDPTDPARVLRVRPPSNPPAIGSRILISQEQIRVQTGGCYGLQIDVGGQSTTVVFRAAPIAEALGPMGRALDLPAAGATCAIGSRAPVGFMQHLLGDGPVYIASTGRVSLQDLPKIGDYWLVRSVWVTDQRELGPVLVRGGRIDAPGELSFGAGPAPDAELRLPIKSYEHTSDQPPGWRIFNGYIRPDSAGCYAMQLDTLTGSRWLVFEVIR